MQLRPSKIDLFGDVQVIYGDEGDMIVLETDRTDPWIARLTRAMMRHGARIQRQ